MRSRWLVAGCVLALVAGACGSASGPAAEPPERPEDEVDAPDDDQEGQVPPLMGDFDREEARAAAQALIGLPEHEVEEAPMRRIVRRGEERFIVTMDLRPGRQNLELDDDGSGTYVVTRVVVEVPDDEGPLVVE